MRSRGRGEIEGGFIEFRLTDKINRFYQEAKGDEEYKYEEWERDNR